MFNSADEHNEDDFEIPAFKKTKILMHQIYASKQKLKKRTFSSNVKRSFKPMFSQGRKF